MHQKAQRGPAGEGEARLVLVLRVSWEEKFPVGPGPCLCYWEERGLEALLPWRRWGLWGFSIFSRILGNLRRSFP